MMASRKAVILRGWLEMNWVISVGCDSVLLADDDGSTRCGLKSPARSIGATSCAMQAIPGPRNGRRSRRCCRRGVDWGGRANAICARSSMPSFISCGPAVSGAPCRGSFRRARRCRATSIVGATTARGSGLARCWWHAPAARPGASPCRRPASSIARARRRRKAAGRAGWTPASASRGASATSSPIPRASCSPRAGA